MYKKRKKNNWGIGVTSIFIPVIFVLAALFFWVRWEGIQLSATEDSVAFIKEHINGRGEIVDFQREIGVDGIEDLKLFLTEKRVKIVYGQITLTWTYQEFVSDEWTIPLRNILLTREYDEVEGRLRVYWKGQDIELYVN